MNKKQSIIFFFSLGTLLIVFAAFFVFWIVDDVKNSPSIEAEMGNKLPDKTSLGIASTSQVAGSAAAAGTVTNNLPQQAEPNNPTSSPASQMDTTSESNPLPDSGTTNPQTNTASSDAGSTAPDRKTYTSDALKISFDYANDLKFVEGTNLLTITGGEAGWKIRFFDDSKKQDIQAWFNGHYNIKDDPNCAFNDGTIKVGTYTSKSVVVGSSSNAGSSPKCDDAGNYAVSSDSSRIVKVEKNKETTDNINKMLTNFKFLN